MSVLYPGAGARRTLRSSGLLFHWRAADGRLDALTGHPATHDLVASGATPGGITGRAGTVIVSGGHSLPRFDQIAAHGLITRLRISAPTAGKDDVSWTYPWYVGVEALSVLVRVWPNVAVGGTLADPGHIFILGNGTSGGGRLLIRRDAGSGNWSALRERAGMGTLTSTVSEVGTTKPFDFLATLSAAGALTVSRRDALGATATGATQTDALAAVAGERWAGDTLILAAGIGLLNGEMWYERVKVARGVKTFAEMDVLT